MSLLLITVMLCGIIYAYSFQLEAAAKRRLVVTNRDLIKRLRVPPVFVNKNDDVPGRLKRKIVRYDNVGDPVYDDDMSQDKGGISVLGINVPFDPLSASLLIFGLIAFNFFVVANL